MTTSTLTQFIDSVSAQDQMTALCQSFHALRKAPGVSPWDQHKFAKWASGPAPSESTRQAAAFVLSVWNGGTPADGGWWNDRDPVHGNKLCVGRFDPVEAIARWDHLHTEAFLAWCRAPFYP